MFVVPKAKDLLAKDEGISMAKIIVRRNNINKKQQTNK